jgi:hypothetical protein
MHYQIFFLKTNQKHMHGGKLTKGILTVNQIKNCNDQADPLDAGLNPTVYNATLQTIFIDSQRHS